MDRMKTSQVMEAMRLTLDEHHRKVRVSIGDISYWPVNADVSGFAHPPVWQVATPMFSSCKIACCLSRLPAALPRLPAISRGFLLPPTTTCCLSPLPRCDCLEKYLRHLTLGRFYGVDDGIKGTMNE